jgi:Rrf2 family protein
MKVSKSVAYSLHGLMYMVRHSTQLPVTIGTISRAERIPREYLAKIFQKLAKGGLVKAVQGRNQGYNFVKPPDQISLLEIFELVEGRDFLGECPLRHCACGGTTDNCAIFAKWSEAAQIFIAVLEQTDLDTATWNHPEHYFDDPGRD